MKSLKLCIALSVVVMGHTCSDLIQACLLENFLLCLTSSLKPMCIPQSNIIFLPANDTNIQLRPTSEISATLIKSLDGFLMFGVQKKFMLVPSPNTVILSMHIPSDLKYKLAYEPGLCIDWVTCVVHTGLQLDLGNPNSAMLTLLVWQPSTCWPHAVHTLACTCQYTHTDRAG